MISMTFKVAYYSRIVFYYIRFHKIITKFHATQKDELMHFHLYYYVKYRILWDCDNHLKE